MVDQAGKSPTIGVIVADDDESTRVWLSHLIEMTDGLELVGEAADAITAVELARTSQPDVAVVDVRMPGGGGPEGTQLIGTFSSGTRVLAFSAYDTAPQVLAMIEAGASGYVVKSGNPDEILAAIRIIAAGGVYMSAGVDATVMHHVRHSLVGGSQEILQRSRIVSLIEDVLARQAISMHYQPIVELATNQVVGYEALARIDSQRRQPPNVWFAEAESVGRLIEFEQLAIATAVTGLDHLGSGVFLALNISPEAASGPALVDSLRGLPVERFVLEITEHSAVADYTQLSHNLYPFRARGLRVAIDDVGAGYASMAHVLNLDPEIIKLDRAFTAGIDQRPNRQTLVDTMRSFAEQTNAELLAEGIETLDELHTMVSLGVGLGQGYLLGRPMPLAEIPADRAARR